MIDEKGAEVEFNVRVRNQSDEEVQGKLLITIKDLFERTVAEWVQGITLPAQQPTSITKTIGIEQPLLWSTKTPHLYRAEISIVRNEDVCDVSTYTFGIRSILFSAKEGFLLNGEPVLLKGTCMHHDNGLLGAAAIEAASIDG